MAEENVKRRESDMVLAPNEYMYVRDETKGHVDLFVGPTKQSLSGTDAPVIYDEKSKRFVKAEFEQATQLFRTAPEGWYVVLKNPTKVGSERGSKQQSGKLGAAELEIGRKVNIPGPCSFPLFPGQMAKVLKGHHLRSNQYLIVCVYDEDAARKNWGKGVVKLAAPDGKKPEEEVGAPTISTKTDATAPLPEAPELTMGQLLVIKGTDVSFYIPPTGVEVIPDEDGKLVRDAVTLERLEYCLLMDESGTKRYERGPAVVFPEPTEVFVDREIERGGKKIKTRKSKAIELNENSGVYVKVIADYEEGTEEFKVGQELFITGQEQMIYFPRAEHAIIKYGECEVQHGVAIPAGEARYVMDRLKGDVTLVEGPTVFLPDPRRQVLMRRVLDFRTCNLLYPDNEEALAHNAKLAGVDINTYKGGAPVAVAAMGVALNEASRRGLISRSMSYSSNAGILANVGDSLESRGLWEDSDAEFSGDAFQRATKYSEPRTIVLGTKYDGAVTTEIHTGYAVLLVKKNGDRRVAIGPRTVKLEYDETPQALTLSRGKPKTTDNMLRTAFLLTRANKVSDVVSVTTKDFCQLNIKLSYRVNFEGDEPEKWFSVENYVKFLCDNLRSRIMSQVQKEFGIEQFFGNHTEILRDIILGKKTGVAGEDRPGMLFEENGMRIYDVEILHVEMKNQEIEKLLVNAQRSVIEGTLRIATERRVLEHTKESEKIRQDTEVVKTETKKKISVLQTEQVKAELDMRIATIEAEAKTDAERVASELALEKARGAIATVLVGRKMEARQADIAMEQEAQKLLIERLEMEIKSYVERAKAIQPELVSALQGFSERALAESAVRAIGPMALIGGNVNDVLANIFANTPFAKHLLPATKENGHPVTTSLPAKS